MSKLKTPLRYPGGKSRAVKQILEHIPEDITSLCSPFFGGGSVELALANKGVYVHGYDKFAPLVWFWHALIEDNNLLAKEVKKLRDDYTVLDGGKEIEVTGCSKKLFSSMRQDLKSSDDSFSYEKAAKFYVINRTSFSGATFSGGWSKLASYKRFTQSSIDRIEDFKAKNFSVSREDFKDSIVNTSCDHYYLDPPYLLEKNNTLYGDSGDMHKDFDHEGLYDILSKKTGWTLSYNDCPRIREMYSGRKIYTPSWSYGMKQRSENTKKKNSSELIIVG